MTIGGFMALKPAACGVSPSVLDLWKVTDENSWMFGNARSALAHLLHRHGTKRLWLPALICPELPEAAGPDCAVLYYSLTQDLTPDTGFLSTALRGGDCVVAVDYFGRSPAQSFRDYVVARDDVLWVEDRAQALDPDGDPWAEWVLYSPRKLFGVPDGGILVRCGGPVAQPDYTGADVTAAVAARQTGSCRDADWRFALYQHTERRNRVSMQGMSRLTRERLKGIDPTRSIRRRQKNFDLLAGLMADIAVLEGPAEGFAPFGFPVRLPDCTAVWRRMCESGVFPARHYAELPSAAAEFSLEHALGAEMMTLPCDQRYGGEEMQRVAAVLREAMR